MIYFRKYMAHLFHIFHNGQRMEGGYHACHAKAAEHFILWLLCYYCLRIINATSLTLLWHPWNTWLAYTVASYILSFGMKRQVISTLEISSTTSFIIISAAIRAARISSLTDNTTSVSWLYVVFLNYITLYAW